MRKPIWIVILFFVISCSSGKQVEQGRKPSGADGGAGTTQPLAAVALEIVPKAVSRDETANLILTGFDVHDAKIEWLLNGTPAESALPNQFKLSEARKGDTLQARALVQGREILSNTVEVLNAPPETASIKLLTELVKPGDTVGVEVTGRDADGDNVTFRYEWTINGEPAGNEERIGRPVRRGDRVSVKVTPFDGESYGHPVELSREIQNLPPIIQEHGEFQFDGKLYTYQVKASDPDGDPLNYAIESPAEGMTIDKSSGLLAWNVPAEFRGKKSVTVVVTDGHGGAAKYILNINIQ